MKLGFLFFVNRIGIYSICISELIFKENYYKSQMKHRIDFCILLPQITSKLITDKFNFIVLQDKM